MAKIHKSFRRQRQDTTDWIGLLSAAVAIFGLIQFVQGIWMAIVHYPSEFRPADDFLSTLGVRAESAPYFTRATVTLGVSMWPLFYSIVHRYGDKVPTSVVAFCALGILSSFGLCGIGTTPYSRYRTMHFVALAVWLIPMLVMLRLRIPHPGQPNGKSSSGISISTVVVAVVYIAGMLASNILSFKFQVLATVSQKLLIVAALLWMVSLIRVIVGTAFEVPTKR